MQSRYVSIKGLDLGRGLKLGAAGWLGGWRKLRGRWGRSSCLVHSVQRVRVLCPDALDGIDQADGDIALKPLRRVSFPCMHPSGSERGHVRFELVFGLMS